MIKNKRLRTVEELWRGFPYLTWEAYHDGDIDGREDRYLRVWFEGDSGLWYTWQLGLGPTEELECIMRYESRRHARERQS